MSSVLSKTKYTFQTLQSLSTLLHLCFPSTIEYKVLLHFLSINTSLTNLVVGSYELKKKQYVSGFTTLSIASTSLLRSNFELKKSFALRKGIRQIVPVETVSSPSRRNLLTIVRQTQRSQKFQQDLQQEHIFTESTISKLEVLTQSLGIGRNIHEIVKPSIHKSKFDLFNLYVSSLMNGYILSKALYTLKTIQPLSKVVSDESIPSVTAAEQELVVSTPSTEETEEFQSPRIESFVNTEILSANPNESPLLSARRSSSITSEMVSANPNESPLLSARRFSFSSSFSETEEKEESYLPPPLQVY